MSIFSGKTKFSMASCKVYCVAFIFKHSSTQWYQHKGTSFGPLSCKLLNCFALPHLTCPLGGFGWINTQQGNYKVEIQKTAKNQDNAFKSNCIKIM